jgi:guanylate kinase
MLPGPEFIYNIMIGTLESFSTMINNPNIQKYGYEIIPIFISVSDEERLYRMINRESKNEKPNYREVSRRFLADMNDLKKYHDVLTAIPEENYFVNNDLDKTVEAIVSLMSKYIKPEE